MSYKLTENNGFLVNKYQIVYVYFSIYPIMIRISCCLSNYFWLAINKWQYRDVNVFIFWKTIVSLWKRRRKIENETIVFKNDRVFQSSFFKNDRFKTIVLIKFVVSLTIVNDDPTLTIVNDEPSLTIVNNNPSLTIVNDYPSLTIVNEDRKPT